MSASGSDVRVVSARWAMSLGLVKICGLGAILAVAAYIVGLVFLLSVGELPKPDDMRMFLLFVNDHRTNLIIALWVLVIAAILNMGALPGIYQLLRGKAALVLVALVASAVGFVFGAVDVIGFLGMGYELAPIYAGSGEASQPALEAIGSTLWTTGALVRSLSHFFFWGIGATMLAYSSLRVRAVPEWAAWLGLIGSLLLGYPNALVSVSAVKDLASLAGLSGTILYGVWLLAIGIALLRYKNPAQPGARA